MNYHESGDQVKLCQHPCFRIIQNYSILLTFGVLLLLIINHHLEENVALQQPSLQSGTFLHHLPHLAVDGGERLLTLLTLKKRLLMLLYFRSSDLLLHREDGGAEVVAGPDIEQQD